MFAKVMYKKENQLINQMNKEKNIFRKLAKAYELNALLNYMANNNA